MSIFSLAKESRNLQEKSNVRVEICTFPGDKGYGKNDLFENNEYVFSFDDIIKGYPNLKRIIIHIPELVVDKMNVAFARYSDYLESIPYVHINILNQNIKYMQSSEEIVKLYRFANHITQTTAHDRYATQETADKFCIPLKHFSVFIDPSQYEYIPYDQKENTIAYSPDKHPRKDDIIKSLKSTLKDYRFIEIRDMSYSEYKSTIAKAKFTITFGEGLDGYLIESTFSGGVGISVYNSDFFPDHTYKQQPFIYDDYDKLLTSLAADITLHESARVYKNAVDSMYSKLSSLYNLKKYRENLKKFYMGQIDYQPSYERRENLIYNALRDVYKNTSAISEENSKYKTENGMLKNEVKSLKNSRQDYIQYIRSMQSSLSWRITAPVRKIKSLFKYLF